ncbi:MAG: hypothetical protein M3P98_00655 [bacterium]|nr:hypothetical protein [bacterium]
MSTSIGDILSGAAPTEPPEFVEIRRYIGDKFGVNPKLSQVGKDIFISAPNSALAGTIQLDLFNMKNKLGIKTNIRVRTGG